MFILYGVENVYGTRAPGVVREIVKAMDTAMEQAVNELAPETSRDRDSAEDDRLAHLVLRQDWPVALCGATVRDNLYTAAAGRDRCAQCLRIANERGLGRPGWQPGT